MENLVILGYFQEIDSDDEELILDALTDLMLVLEDHSMEISDGDVSSTLDEFLSKEELIEIITFLESRVTYGDFLTAKILAAMGHSSANIALLPMIRIIKNFGRGFDEECWYQALEYLNRLVFGCDSMHLEYVKSLVKDNELDSAIVNLMPDVSPLENERLYSLAEAVVQRLSRIDEFQGLE